jgi:hypothetical protein
MSGRILRDLAAEEPAEERSFQVAVHEVSIVHNGQLLYALLDDPGNMPLEASPPHRTSLIMSGLGTGAKRTDWKTPIPRGQGRKKAFSEDTAEHVPYHPSQREKEVAVDANTKARRRPKQVRLSPADECILASRRIVLRPATKMQTAGPTFCRGGAQPGGAVAASAAERTKPAAPRRV